MIDVLIDALKRIKKLEKEKEKASEKRFEMGLASHSAASIGKANANLTAICVELDKAKTDFARLYTGSGYDVGIGEKEYEVTGFHVYKH